jgi:hypothetical protein
VADYFLKINGIAGESRNPRPVSAGWDVAANHEM